jgi:hypothetical protein
MGGDLRVVSHGFSDPVLEGKMEMSFRVQSSKVVGRRLGKVSRDSAHTDHGPTQERSRDQYILRGKSDALFVRVLGVFIWRRVPSALPVPRAVLNLRFLLFVLGALSLPVTLTHLISPVYN